MDEAEIQRDVSSEISVGLEERWHVDTGCDSFDFNNFNNGTIP